jgi:hypothetical protein
MRQHAIPQNILDIEFKLFTKFTLKEFAYLAIGIGFGGLMIYLTVREDIPSIIGIPVFILSSTLGIVLGLVPINDQDADVFIKNFIFAITNPTQRVWLNKEMKDQRLKPEVKPTEDGQIVPKDVKQEKKKIIGVTIPFQKNDELKKDEDIEDPLDEKNLKIDEELLTSTPSTQSRILITDENISNYQFNIKSTDKLPGNINIWLSTKDFKPVPNVVTYLKSSDGKVLYANKTGSNGYFLTSKLWDPGTYMLEFDHPVYKFPEVQLELTKKENKSPIKISTL